MKATRRSETLPRTNDLQTDGLRTDSLRTTGLRSIDLKPARASCVGLIFCAAIFGCMLYGEAAAASAEISTTGAAHDETAHGGMTPLDIDPLASTPAMHEFIDSRIKPEYQRETRLRLLQEAIFDPEDGLGITYGTHGTFTAAETFEKATGNCLSFTLLFVSLARHMGFTAHFVEVDEVTGWSHRGDVNFSHWHMFVEVELSNGIVQVDFLPWLERRYKARRRIDESRVKAHFFNNLGAQELARGGAKDLAISYFERSLELAPDFTPARINLAAGLRRAGRIDEAEQLLLEILEDHPENPQAASNLANLYAAEGRDHEARKWTKKRDRYLRRNPFHHFRLGLRAFRAGEAETARGHFRDAIARQTNESVFHEYLGRAHVQLQDSGKARAAFRRAIRMAESKGDEERIEELMTRLNL